jgi:hypothetical protein
MHDGTYLIWHDVHPRYSVPAAITRAARDGWRLKTLPTSCNMGVCCRSPSQLDMVNTAFDQAVRGAG